MARTEFCDVGGHCQEIYQALIGSKLSSIVLINQISYEATFSHYVLHSHIDHNLYVLTIFVTNSSFLLH